MLHIRIRKHDSQQMFFLRLVTEKFLPSNILLLLKSKKSLTCDFCVKKWLAIHTLNKLQTTGHLNIVHTKPWHHFHIPPCFMVLVFGWGGNCEMTAETNNGLLVEQSWEHKTEELILMKHAQTLTQYSLSWLSHSNAFRLLQPAFSIFSMMSRPCTYVHTYTH